MEVRMPEGLLQIHKIRNPNSDFEITCSLTIEKKQQATVLVAVLPNAERANVLKLVAQEPKKAKL